jgi:hypothetical protein
VPWKLYFLGEIWEMLGKIFLLTLFDFDWWVTSKWINRSSPIQLLITWIISTRIDVPWMPDLFKTQFAIAVVISIAFPLGASKYHNFLEGAITIFMNY